MRRPLSLAGVALGAAGVAAALTALYLGMRSVMVEHGGSCSSGGPYEVAAGHTCSSQEMWVMFVAPFVGLALTWLLIAASDAWSDERISGVGPLLWAAMFGALGWNFIDLGIDPVQEGDAQAVVSGAGAWILCGVLFWAMALGGLVYAGYAMKDYFFPGTGEAGLAGAGLAPPPLVRAAVNVAATQAAGVPEPVSSTQLLFGNGETRTVGSPWGWLLTVVVFAGAGAAAVAVIAG
ncbi:hypothetical protein ABIE44_001830 [Marmoricola sp. OAE513]|uniref:hypothetical protein n=1 Tax=Marmoricola sp. OAE513 TaxID=2817894 RepID=UPI001AE7B699